MSYNNFQQNPYFGYNGLYQPSQPFYQGQQLQCSQPSQMAQNTQSMPKDIKDIPISEIRIASEQEARGYMLPLNTRVVFKDRDKNRIYVKGVNYQGQAELKIYDLTEVDKDTKENVDGGNFVDKEELKNFATKTDISTLAKQIVELQKQIKIKEILGSDTEPKE